MTWDIKQLPRLGLKAYGEAVSQYGTWDWADIVAPAITQADEGFRVDLTYIFGGHTVLTMGESR